MARCNSYGIPRYGKLGPNTLMVREREVLARICDNLISKGFKPTEAQRLAQMAMANNILIWRCFSRMLAPTFPDRKIGQTEYNAFMSLNMKRFSIFLPKEMVQGGATVLAPVQINTGSLNPAIQYWKDSSADWMVTSILLGDLTINANTTVGEFTRAVVANNGPMFTGGKSHCLGFFLGHQSIDVDTHYPVASMTGRRIDLDDESTEKLWEKLGGDAGFQTYKGHLATPYALRNLYAWIHLAKDERGHVTSSTQKMTGDNNAIITQYTTEEAFLAACESYGGFTRRFLDPFRSKIHVFDYTLPTAATVQGQNPDNIEGGSTPGGSNPGGSNPGGGGSNPGGGGNEIE